MKKHFLLMLCISLCFSSASFAATTTYLVYLGTNGAATWGVGVTGTRVNLATVNAGNSASLNAWFTDKSLATPLFSGATFAAGDQVWIINGTYTLTGTLTFKDQVSVYGGFAGNETATTTRPKSDLNGNGTTSNWEFNNASVIDGASSYSVASVTTNTATTTFDGLTIQNIKCSNSTIVDYKQVMQNCIVTGAVANAAANNCMFGMGHSGQLKDSYFYNNNAGTNYLVSFYAGGTGTVSGCIFDNNTGSNILYTSGNSKLNVSTTTFSNNLGSALSAYVNTASNQINVTTCNFINNQTTGTGGSAIVMGLSGTPASVGLTITGSTFTNNATSGNGQGGAIYVYSAVNVSISGSTFTGNAASGGTSTSTGGAVSLTNGGTNSISNCKFTANTATGSSGGSAIYSKVPITANNCVFAKNLGPYVVAFNTTTVGSTFQNCTFASNTNAGSPTNINLTASASPAYTFTNSLFYNCTSTIFSTGVPTTASCTNCGFDIALPAYAGTGCITGITSGSFKDVANGDWSLSSGSGAINTGATIAACSPDISGVTRPQGGAYDMGAYEYIAKTVPTVTINTGTYTYNKIAQGPNSATNTGTSTNYIFTYTGTGATTYGPSTFQPTNAGTYSVTASVAENATYSFASATTSFTISPKSLSIGAASIASKTYDGSATSGSVTPGTLSGFVSGETVTVNTAVGTYPDANVGTGKLATIVYTLANGTGGGLAANYSLANGTATGDITAATLILNNAATTFNATDYTVPQLANSDLVVSAGEFVVNQTTATVKSVTVAPGAKLSVGSNTLSATNGITLQSDATGTATLMDSYSSPTINATVKQYVTAGRNWYMSAPINNTASVSVLNRGASVQDYDEINGAWEVATGNLTSGKGYIQVASAGQGTTGTVSFNGTTNSGNVAVTLTNTPGKGKGFNLVGNPYPSYLSWSAVANNSINTDPTTGANMPTGTIWYRTISDNGKSAWVASTGYNAGDVVYNGTRFYTATSSGTSDVAGGPSGTGTGIADNSVVWDYAGSMYVFATVSLDGTATPSTVSNLIPPMQAFWVRSNGGTLTFTNAMRTHETVSNRLKAPKSTANEMPLVRLKVTNGVSADEAVIYASAFASNALDAYDAPKYFNTVGSNQPEIYTQVGNEKLAINAMSEFTKDTEIQLGFSTEKENDFSISASEFRNFGLDMQVILKDKQTNMEYNLSIGQGYKFSSSSVNDATRFSILFRALGTSTGLYTDDKEIVQVFVNAANQIEIIAPPKSNYSIYNAVGKKVGEGITTSNLQTTNFKLASGVYLVRVGNSNSTRVIVK